jgi:hypothetical protein
MTGGALSCRWGKYPCRRIRRGIIYRLEEVVADSHTIEGMQKNYVSLIAVVDQHFV